jgi:IS30 family transposase
MGFQEESNKAIVGTARSMLHDQALPFYLWAKACSTAVYLLNKSPHRALGWKSPEEAFTGEWW